MLTLEKGSHPGKTWRDKDSHHAQSSSLAERLEGNDRFQEPSKLATDQVGPKFVIDTRSGDGRARIGSFLKVVEGCQEVTEDWAPWAGRSGAGTARLSDLRQVVDAPLMIADSYR